ncbi:hypothetical protein P3773_11345 [Pseudomonas aeruginosa]|nr:hypothetical protein [Pseudomonas aeruginosa]
MSNELTDVRCPCGAEFQADSYDAGFIAGSGMCQNCDAALPPKDICTCPSGDGSLRHPCPEHPAVEQVGGDERVIGWRERILAAHPNSDPGFWPDALLVEHMAAEIADLRAALAQPSPAQAEQAEPERPEVVAWQYRVTAGPQTGWSLWHPGKGEEFERSYTVERRPLMTVAQYERITAKLHDALDESDGDRWKMRSERDAANARLHEVATACATAEQERDAALARVAELTATRNRYGVDAHYFNKNLQRILRDFESFTPDELARSLIILAKVADEKVVAQAQQLHDLDKQCRDDVARALGLRPSQERGFAWSYLLASIKSCVKASEDAAQAQHSVPDGLRELLEMLVVSDLRKIRYAGAWRREVHDRASSILALLAAGPGKGEA